MRNLRFRRAARTSALGTVVMLAALSLTACQGDDAAAQGNSSTPPAGSSSPAATAGSGVSGDKGSTVPAADRGKDSAASASGSTSGSASASGGSKSTARPRGSNNNDSSPEACTGANTKLTITEVTRPVNHMLLTVTNTGSKACSAYYYPALRFGEAQSVPRSVDESKPQAVATINPGESAYAGVLTSSADGSGSGGYSTKDLSVSFQNIKGNFEHTGSAVKVPLSKSVYVDSTLAVTYWQMSMDDALTY